jgi:regulation of enolase protein 1 (concanavalin A-like superfamily)
MNSHTLTLLSGVTFALALNASAKPTVACYIASSIADTTGFGVKYRLPNGTFGFTATKASPSDPDRRWGDADFAAYHMEKIQQVGVDLVIHDATNWNVVVNGTNSYGNVNNFSVAKVQAEAQRRNMKIAFLMRAQEERDPPNGFPVSIPDANERAKVIYENAVKNPNTGEFRSTYFWCTADSQADPTQNPNLSKPLIVIFRPNTLGEYTDAYNVWLGKDTANDYLKKFRLEFAYQNKGWGWEDDSESGLANTIGDEYVKFIKASTILGSFPKDNGKKTPLQWETVLENVAKTGLNASTRISIISDYDGTGDCGSWAETNAAALASGGSAAYGEQYRLGNLEDGPGYYNLVKARFASLPTNWTSDDIGAPNVSGNAGRFTEVDNTTTWTINGGGMDIGSTGDQMNFTRIPKSGDFTITAKIVSVQGENPNAKAGIMVRENNTAGSRHFSLLVNASQNVVCQVRTTAGGTAVNVSPANIKVPCWLRITRTNNVFTAFAAPNSVAIPTTWTTLKTNTIGMASPANAGLAIASLENLKSAKATFTKVTVGPNP